MIVAVVWVAVAGVLVVVAVVSLFLKRHGESAVPSEDWTATSEVFVDPGTGRRMRVWLDACDGGRHYVPEGDHPRPV